MLPSSWKKTVVSELTAELSQSPSIKPTIGKPDLIRDPANTAQIEHSDIAQTQVVVARPAEPIRNAGPTHPLSPGVLSEFPPFEYTTPPVRPQPRPLQVKLEDGRQSLGEKTLSPNPSLGRNLSTKKGRPPPLTLPQLSPFAKVESCCKLTSGKQA